MNWPCVPIASWKRRFKAAQFRQRKTLPRTSTGRSTRPSLASRFMTLRAAGSSARDETCSGWDHPGLGKSHLVQALGYQAGGTASAFIGSLGSGRHFWLSGGVFLP